MFLATIDLSQDTVQYGKSNLQCLIQVVPMAGVDVSNVDMANLAAVKAAIVPGKTKLVGYMCVRVDLLLPLCCCRALAAGVCMSCT